MAPKKRVTTVKIRDLKPAKPAKVKGGKMPTRHQANIKFGDVSM